MSDQDLLLQFIASQLTNLRNDFRTDLCSTEHRLIERINSVADVTGSHEDRLRVLEHSATYRRGAVWAISMVAAGLVTILNLLIQHWVR